MVELESGDTGLQPSSQESRIVVCSQDEWWRAGTRPPTTVIRERRFAEVLRNAGTLVVLSRADSALYCVSEMDEQVQVTSYRLPGPMGFTYRDRRVAIGCARDIRTFVDVADEGADEAMFLPVAVHSTGALSIHDVSWGQHWNLWFTNTLFSSVCTAEPGLGFKHRWQPKFIDAPPSAIDACHLNGMIVEHDEVRYATALASSADANGWRSFAPDCGVLIDGSGEILCESLSLPHSPMQLQGELFLLESGKGRLLRFDEKMSVVAEVGGVVRGLAASNGVLFVGVSTVRAQSGLVTDILKLRFPQTTACAIRALSDTGDAITQISLPFIGEISSVHLIPRARVSFLRPDATQHAGTFVYER